MINPYLRGVVVRSPTDILKHIEPQDEMAALKFLNYNETCHEPQTCEICWKNWCAQPQPLVPSLMRGASQKQGAHFWGNRVAHRRSAAMAHGSLASTPALGLSTVGGLLLGAELYAYEHAKVLGTTWGTNRKEVRHVCMHTNIALDYIMCLFSAVHDIFIMCHIVSLYYCIYLSFTSLPFFVMFVINKWDLLTINCRGFNVKFAY